jgi:hypothetical protein
MYDSIFEMNLPKPNADLEREILRCAHEAPLDTVFKTHHENFQNVTVNAVSRQYEKTDEVVIKLAKEQYQVYFDEEIFPVVGILTNVHPTEKYACWPPHSDRERVFCMNYYYEEGGENVTTVFYKQMCDNTPGLGTGKRWQYTECEVHEPIHFEMNKWYGLAVRRAHSIENVENRRIMFSLSFYDINFDEFKLKYKHYLR